MLRSLMVFLALILTGCMTPTPHYNAPTKYYGMSLEVSAAAVSSGFDNRVDQLTQDAPTLLAKGTRVAFFPPDSCLNTSAAPHGASQVGVIQMQCGILISNLETSLAKAGYEVVSWQALKPSTTGDGSRVIDRAKELGVKILFEVDQLSVNARAKGSAQLAGMKVFEQTTYYNRKPLKVSKEVGDACKGVASNISKYMAENWLSFEENSATFSSKGVDVDTGRALWYYQKTLSMNPDAKRTVELDLFYEAAPNYETYVKEYNEGQWIGYLMVLLGGVGVTVGIPAEQDGLIAVGAVSAVSGLLIIFLSNAFSPDTIDVPATYAPPSEILCVTKDVEPPFLPTKERRQESGDSSSFTFEQSAAGDDDKKRQITEKLIQMTTEDFVKELNAMTNRR